MLIVHKDNMCGVCLLSIHSNYSMAMQTMQNDSQNQSLVLSPPLSDLFYCSISMFSCPVLDVFEFCTLNQRMGNQQKPHSDVLRRHIDLLYIFPFYFTFKIQTINSNCFRSRRISIWTPRYSYYCTHASPIVPLNWMISSRIS